MSSALENEDLENVPLVRMEDVQPSRDRIDRALATRSPPSNVGEVFEICVIDKGEYNDCTIGDDIDSNIGSMVSIQSEEVAEEDAEDSENGELVVPGVLDPPRALKQETIAVEQTRQNTWPTLEILPGGVIKNVIDWESNSTHCTSELPTTKQSHEEMSYACAKCSQTFKYLFCLVKHVKLHEAQKKIKDPLMIMSPLEKEMVLIRRERNELEKTYKGQEVEVLARSFLGTVPRIIRSFRIQLPTH